MQLRALLNALREEHLYQNHCAVSGHGSNWLLVGFSLILRKVLWSDKDPSVPAQYASFPIVRQLFARVSADDNMEANVSTFAAEMRETAFILRNIDRSSMYERR